MQGEIIEVLEKEKKPLGRSDIAKKLNQSPILVSISLRKLLKHNEIKCIELDRTEALKRYKCKQTMRLYYV